MKLGYLVILGLFLLFIFPSSYGGYIEQYGVSPELIPGMYAKYKVLLHSDIEELHIRVLEILSNSSIKLEVILTDLNHTQHVYNKTISVYENKEVYIEEEKVTEPYGIGAYAIKIIDKENSEYIDLVIIDATDGLLFGVSNFILSPHLEKNDFINLEARAIGGLTISRIVGEVFNYAYRAVYITTNSIQTSYWMWDKDTGIIIEYISVVGYTKWIRLIETNMWNSPKDTLVSDPLAIPKTIFGVFFSHWELWAITLGGIVFMATKGWIGRYIEDRGRLRMNPRLLKTLNEVEKQEKKVKSVVVKDV